MKQLALINDLHRHLSNLLSVTNLSNARAEDLQKVQDAQQLLDALSLKAPRALSKTLH